MAKQPAKAVKKPPVKAKPKATPTSGPPKHLAYISEEEAKILDMILTIKKNAKGKDGKPIPQTYNPGQGHPLEFLTELTSAQISELLAKTDGTANMTPEGVPTLYMEASGSGNVKDSSPGQSGTKNSNSGSTNNAGGEGGRAGESGMRDSVGANSGNNKSNSQGSDSHAGDRGTPGMNQGSNSFKGGASEGSQSNSKGTMDASREAQGNVNGTPGGDSAFDSGMRSMAEQRISQPSARTPSDSQLSRLATEKPSSYRSPSDSQLAATLRPEVKTSLNNRNPLLGNSNPAVQYGALTDLGPNLVKDKSASANVALDPSIAGRLKGQPTISGPGKTDRENVTTLEQNGVSPFGPNVGFKTDTEAPLSALAGLVSGPNKTNREAVAVAQDPSLAGRVQAANTTTINKNPTGPMPQRSTDVPSELSRMTLGSQFNAPLADTPGAYRNSELANAITGETAPGYDAPGNLENTRSVMSDPTAGTLAPSPSGKIGTFTESPTVSGPGKTDREVAQSPTSVPGKTDRVRDIILGNAPVPKSNVLPFRNGVASASLTRVAQPAPNRNSVPDSSLSPLATQKPDDLIQSPSPAERTLQPSRPAAAPAPVSGVQQQGSDLISSPSPQERALQPSQPVAAPSPVDGTSDLGMPDISYDANNVSQTPAELGYEGTATPAQPASGTPPATGTGGDEPTGTTDIGTQPTPNPEPVPTPGPPGSEELMPGIMPWDRGAYAEIAQAYEAAGLTYTPQQFQAAFYNEQPYTIEHPVADAALPSADPQSGIMPWDMQTYGQLKKSYAAIGQSYTPQQFISQFYATPQQQAA